MGVVRLLSIAGGPVGARPPVSAEYRSASVELDDPVLLCQHLFLKQGCKDLTMQKLIPQPAVERLHECIFSRGDPGASTLCVFHWMHTTPVAHGQ
jgi:hypothetical protein